MAISAPSTRPVSVRAAEGSEADVGRRTSASLAFWVALAMIAALLGLNLFSGLGTVNIAAWDESRHAVNAYEMLQRGDWLGNTWRGALDYFNLKPPMSMWAQMISYQLFGYTPFAFRLPSAIATIATIAVVTSFVHRVAGRVGAITAALALVTCQHFISIHNARTGDPDALFILGTTVALLAVLVAPRRPRLLLLATSAISFAFLSKSFHVGLLLVVAAIYLIATRRGSAIRLRHVLLAGAGVLPLLAWAIARAAYDGSAFLGSMFVVDVLHRTESPAEGNAAGPQYYAKLLVQSYWMWLAVIAVAVVALLLLQRRGALRVARGDVAILFGLTGWPFAVFVVFSLMATKLAWYTLAAYPALAAIAGICVGLAARPIRARPLAGVAAAGVVVAAVLSQASILPSVLHTTDDPAQATLMSLHRDPRYAGMDIYADPAIGGWSPGLVAAAELGGDLHPVDGASAGSPRSLVLLHKGSPDAARLGAAGGKPIAEVGEFLVVHDGT